jgi:tryptophan halogenase
MLGDQRSYAWHVDAERFPVIVRELVALPLGVRWVQGYVSQINKNDNGYITSLDLKDGSNIEGDIFVDCTGFHRLLMKQMPTEWQSLSHLPTQSAIVAPVKYKDPYAEMKPYTQSYAQKNGWNFIISLYSRMGSGYIFDKNSEDTDSARERFIKYWDGYEFIKEPRLIEWQSGWFKDAWIKNVVGVGMGQGFVDPMEANSIYVAQSCIQMLDQVLQKYSGDIPDIAKRSYSRQAQKLEKQIADFISYHFTLSKRSDSPMWQKWGNNSEDAKKNWKEYRSPRGYTGRNVFLDYQWAQQQVYLDQWDDGFELNINEKLLPLAKANFDYIKNKGEALSEYAPHIYDYLKQTMYDGATYSEILENDLH